MNLRTISSQGFEDQIRTDTSKFVATKVTELYKQLMIKKTWLQVRDSYKFGKKNLISIFHWYRIASPDIPIIVPYSER